LTGNYNSFRRIILRLNGLKYEKLICLLFIISKPASEELKNAAYS